MSIVSIDLVWILEAFRSRLLLSTSPLTTGHSKSSLSPAFEYFLVVWPCKKHTEYYDVIKAALHKIKSMSSIMIAEGCGHGQ